MLSADSSDQPTPTARLAQVPKLIVTGNVINKCSNHDPIFKHYASSIVKACPLCRGGAPTDWVLKKRVPINLYKKYFLILKITYYPTHNYVI